MKRILLVAVIALCGIAAQAQNKIFEKYAKMEGVEYVCINQAFASTKPCSVPVCLSRQAVKWLSMKRTRKALTSAGSPIITE